MLYENISVQDMYDELIFYSNIACSAFIPTYNSSKIKNSAAPWINDELRALIREKKNLRYINCIRKWKDPVLNKEYRVICKLDKSEVKRFRLIYEQDIAGRAKKEPKILYKYLNSQQVFKESMRALKNLIVN